MPALTLPRSARKPYDTAKHKLDRAVKALAQGGSQDTREASVMRAKGACKAYYEEASGDLRAYFFASGDGKAACRLHSKTLDILLLRLLKLAVTFYGGKDYRPSFALLATGGYGRQETAPHSDIDIVFLWRKAPSKRESHIIDFILYGLWDIGLRVGHASRTIEQNIRIAKRDQTVATGLLESRLIVGDRELYGLLRRRFTDEVIGIKGGANGRGFALKKLDERDARHVRMGDTRYVLEPNIKEGKGALRDLHLIRWIALSFYRLKDVGELYDLGIFTAADARSFERAMGFFMTLRFYLHYFSDRATEILTFDMQMQLAEKMGYRDTPEARAVERLMRSYFLHATDVAELTRILATDLRQKINRKKLPQSKMLEGFPLSAERLNVADAEEFSRDPIKILQIFELGLRHDLDFHPDVFRSIRKAFGRIHLLRDNSEAYGLFLRILTADKGQERILRTLGEAGFLGRFLLDFGKVQAQMQYDMYHVYTTDEHTIRAIGNLNRIELGQSREAHPLACAEIKKISTREVLYMAVFLHDIAKGQKGDHSILGARLALRLCPKFGFTQDQCELVAWLVEHHLLMSNTAFKRNLDDAQTISDFIDIVRTPERLRLLLCLTVADITAVGPAVWNNWKAHLLRVLHRRAIARMGDDISVKEAFEADLQGVQGQLADMLDYDDKRIEEFLQMASPSYYLSYTPEQLARHAGFIFAADDKASDKQPRLSIDMQVDEKHAALHLLIYVADGSGLMAKICGAIALCDFSIVEARTNILKGGMSLVTLTVQNLQANSLFEADDLRRLRENLLSALSGKVDTAMMAKSLASASLGGYAKRTEVFSVTPHIQISNNASVEYTMIEVKGRDRIGLMFALSDSLHNLGMYIGHARIATFGEQAHDVFYIQNAERQKITDEASLENIQKILLETLQRGGAAYI